MICQKCGTEHETKVCPTCRQKAVGDFFVAAAKSALFFAVFSGIQLAVQFVFLLARAVQRILEGADPSFLIYELTEEAMNYACRMTVLSSLLTILAIGVIYRIRRKPLTEEIRFKKTGYQPLLIAAVFGVALQVVINVTVSCLPWPAAWMESMDIMSDMILSESLPWQILAAVILGPVTEELIFRGMIHTRFRRVLPPFWAAFVSGIIFGLAHGTPIQFFYATSIGVILGLVMDRFDSIIPCILLHIVFNGVTLLPLYEDVSAGGITLMYVICVLVSVACAILLPHVKVTGRAPAVVAEAPIPEVKEEEEEEEEKDNTNEDL